MKRALVTGGAGFIGSHLVDRLLEDRWHVTAVDNFDPFYAKETKLFNIAPHLDHANYEFCELDIRDAAAMREQLCGDYDVIVHLAAKAGVRPSISAPSAYYEVNVAGTQNLLELAREWGVPQFVFASSSSVYGVNPDVPWREDAAVLLPISPYASSKVSGELLGHVYSHLYGIRFVGLRFFTVFGPRQRPDLAIHRFAMLAREGKPLPVFGDGSTSRDYTYVLDTVQGIRAAMDYNGSAYEIINLGNDSPVSLLELIESVRGATGSNVRLEWLPEQAGDVPRTLADISKARRLLGYAPKTSFHAGIEAFVKWFDTANAHTGHIMAAAR